MMGIMGVYENKYLFSAVLEYTHLTLGLLGVGERRVCRFRVCLLCMEKKVCG